MFDLDRAKKAATVFEEWMFANPGGTIDISDVALSVWGYRAALNEIERLLSLLGQFQDHENQTHEAMEALLGNSDSFVELTRELVNLSRMQAARIKELEGTSSPRAGGGE